MTSVRPASAPASRGSSPPESRFRIATRRRLGRDWRLAALFLAPTAVLVGGLVLVPIAWSVVTSTTERHGQQSVFVGLANYLALADDEQFHTGVVNSFVFTAYAEVFKAVLGLAAALLLHHRRRGRAVLAGLLLLPWVVPTVVTAFSWRSLLDPIFGSVNMLLTESGIGPLLVSAHLVDSWPAGWLSEPSLAMPSVIGVNVWKGVPFFTVAFLAGLKAIPTDLYEAATVDGASPWRRFVHVTLPGLRHVITVTVTLSSIWTFNNFDLIWLLTQGGPGDATAPYVLVAYSKAILQLQYGAGAAVTLVMLPVIGSLVFVLVRLLRRDSGVAPPRRARKPRPDRSARATRTVRTALPWVVAVVTAALLAWASPHIFWKAAVVLGVFLLVAAVVGRVVSALGARGVAGRRRWCRGWRPGSPWPGCSCSSWPRCTGSSSRPSSPTARSSCTTATCGRRRGACNSSPTSSPPSRSAAGTSTRCWCPWRPPWSRWSAPPSPATPWPGCGSGGRRASPSRCW
ncbi:sugar ABC transporter permease [Micromonospora sp. RL09-050-HVF-A]|uniref:carbohydrate ABC transporter permease n=1 Tax=Micromonospora sp. RL09-050-HVF-A TaxID=1703433 RepID=UPI0027E353DF|nr:sugar ABC transporter permease [Micromonospora sp. RL09-050-HVF-A]